MQVVRTHSSPNFEPVPIPVEFAVLHYTACDLAKTLEIFTDPASRVAAHFVIAGDGACLDLGGFLDGPVLRGAHAGKSRLVSAGTAYEAFNGFSIGIELVNLNGNLFDYTERQYEALTELLRHLGARFPALRQADRLIGHEHVAGDRGKCDPGVRFDWARLLAGLGLAPLDLHRRHVCDAADLAFLANEARAAPVSGGGADFWPDLSVRLETRIRERRAGGASGA